MERRFDYDAREKGRAYSADPYRLPREQWLEPLATEFSAYEKWRTASVFPGRCWQQRQRPETFAKSVIEYECFFGYQVSTAGRAASCLRLKDILNTDLLHGYAYWHAEVRAGGASRFIEKSLGTFLAAARCYFKSDADTLDRIVRLKMEMKPNVIRDQRLRWVSLSTLEKVGEAEYPNGQSSANSVYSALAAQRSLIIRLMVRRPLRSRNVREMQLGRNLYRESGNWMIEFLGNELEVERRGSQPNIYRISFPPDLERSLEEFLQKWRPVLNDKDAKSVFLTMHGQPLSQGALNKQIQKAVYSYTGRPTNVHLIRHIWATEYIERTQNFSVAASVLGDKLETVLRHYAHLRTHNAGKHADDFLAEVLGNGDLHGKR
jgi:integrase